MYHNGGCEPEGWDLEDLDRPNGVAIDNGELVTLLHAQELSEWETINNYETVGYAIADGPYKDVASRAFFLAVKDEQDHLRLDKEIEALLGARGNMSTQITPDQGEFDLGGKRIDAEDAVMTAQALETDAIDAYQEIIDEMQSLGLDDFATIIAEIQKDERTHRQRFRSVLEEIHGSDADPPRDRPY